MSKQLLRTAIIVALLLSSGVRLPAAAALSAQQQIEVLRQQQVQALAKSDFVAAARIGQELKALEVSLSTAGTAAPAPAPAPVVSPATSTFFSAPASSPALAPAASSSAFTLPGSPSATFTPPPAPRTFTAPALSAPAPAPAPAAPLATSPFTTSRAPASFAPLTAAPLVAEEPRPAELPPAVVEIRSAEAALSKLEEFRMAESNTARRSTAPVEPARPSLVPPPSALFAPATPATPATPFNFAPAPSVNLTSPDSDPRRRLDDLTRRRAELQAEADRLARENVDWESRYNAAKAELARLETENKGRDRLQTIRDEIVRLDADATRLMQEMEASRVDQDRRARELIPRSTSGTSWGTLGGDRSTVPASAAAPAERRGPQFLPVGTSRPATVTPGDGNIVRTGRSGVDTVALTRDLDRLGERKELILREMDEAQLKFNLSQRELATAQRTGIQADVDRWTKEGVDMDARYKLASAEFARLDSEMQSKIAALKGASAGEDPDVVNVGDTVRLIVAEDDSYNAVYPVRRDGTIAVKNVGKVAVGGKLLSDVEALIKAALEDSQLTKATVTLEFVNKPDRPGGGGGSGLPPTDQPTIIYIAGEFITPGPLKVPEGVAPTLITTIIRSGGITPSGDLTRTKLLRIENGQGAVEEVNVAAILSGNIPPTDIALNSGDIIMIPAFAPVVYVTGNVNKPGTLRLFQDETLTAYSAILRAGGFSRFANLKKCTVVRDLGNGEKMQMPLNVKEIQKGLAPDIVLQGRDIVVIPESFFSF